MQNSSADQLAAGPLKIAIVGSGIAGLSAAHTLCRKHDVTLFENADYVGGHTNTIDVETRSGEVIPVDTGFIVFNNQTYPNFIRLMDQLGVASKSTNMSFSVSDPANQMEYASHLSGLIARKRNLVDPRFLGMLRDKFRFDALCKDLLNNQPEALAELTLKEFIERHQLGENFARWYILPMAAAVWSAPIGQVGDYPMLTLTTFLKNHGLLGVNDAPTWRVICGGSKQYVKALLQQYQGELKLSTHITSIKRSKTGVDLQFIENGEKQKAKFDHVVMACHSDQALALLSDASELEQEILGGIAYQENEAVLHTDTSLLPQRKRAYAAWNYQLPTSDAPRATLTYNMNRLQGIKSADTYCVTLNQTNDIDSSKIIKRIDYAHPVYNHQTVASQARWAEISNLASRTHFAGAYWFYGFHEDGTRSGLRVAEQFGCSLDDCEPTRTSRHVA